MASKLVNTTVELDGAGREVRQALLYAVHVLRIMPEKAVLASKPVHQFVPFGGFRLCTFLVEVVDQLMELNRACFVRVSRYVEVDIVSLAQRTVFRDYFISAAAASNGSALTAGTL